MGEPRAEGVSSAGCKRGSGGGPAAAHPLSAGRALEHFRWRSELTVYSQARLRKRSSARRAPMSAAAALRFGCLGQLA